MRGRALEEALPFRPRLRPRAFLRRLLARPSGASGGVVGPLLVLAALGGFLFSFAMVFRALGAVAPAGSPGAAGGPLEQGAPAVVWLVLAAGCAGFLALAMHRQPDRKVGLKAGAWAAMAREGLGLAAARLGRRIAKKRSGEGEEKGEASAVQGSTRWQS